MTGPYEFKRWDGVLEPLGDWYELPRGFWTRVTGSDFKKLNSVFTCCPECGIVGRLPHQVDAGGNVTPSLVCPYPPCTMHLQPVRLLDWNYGEKPRD